VNANMFLCILLIGTNSRLHTPKNTNFAAMINIGNNGHIEDWRSLSDIKQDYIHENSPYNEEPHSKMVREGNLYEDYNPDHTKRNTVIRNEVFDLMLKKNDFRYVDHEIRNMIKRDREEYQNLLAEIGLRPKKDNFGDMNADLNDKKTDPQQKKNIAFNLEVQQHKKFLLNRFENEVDEDRVD
ncbi:hypothetical protein THOM_0328, partial [Trachipleistophora hominis]